MYVSKSSLHSNHSINVTGWATGGLNCLTISEEKLLPSASIYQQLEEWRQHPQHYIRQQTLNNGI